MGRAIATRLLAVWLLSAGLAAVRAAEPPAPGAEFFEARIRPVLAESCFGCHGSKVQKGGLRLDSRDALMAGGDSGPVVSPGDPDGSALVAAVRHDGPTKMPPKKRLSAQATHDIATWVRMGAPWSDAPRPPAKDASEGAERHWAFQPVQDPPVPRVKNAAWMQGPIDAFVLARLEEWGLAPSRDAERRTLVRRVTFDLIGLPPTAEEVDAFVADDAPDAFARLVDRLLASPRYGERWGRFWLDVARYADTKGYVFFEDANFPWAWTYRDYVIEALNEDRPYDRFLVEQIAADRLPPDDDKRPLRALGFLTLGGRFMNNPHDIIDDRIDVVTRGLLGLTVTCARCHDHKFDPIPTRDYYSLYGVFASSAEPTVPPLISSPPRTPDYEKFARELAERERKLHGFVASKYDELIRLSKSRAAEYLLTAQAALGQPTTEDFMLIADGGDLNPKMLLRWQVFLRRTRQRRDPVFAPWHALAALPEADFATRAESLIPQWADAPDPARTANAAIVAALIEDPPRTLADVARMYGRLLKTADLLGEEADRRASLNGTAARPLPFPALEELRSEFRAPDAPPNVPRFLEGDLDLLPDRPSQAELQKLRKAVEDWRASGPGAPPRAMALEDAAAPVEPRVFVRGNPNNPGVAVPRQFLHVLAGPTRRPFQSGSGRLELARAIADGANPLTARVLVNRVWMHHFGTPLVGTPSDFGLRSDPPTHPALLDHLATAFVRDGWSVKRLHRRIVLSHTYQQASDDRPEARRIDPENALLWRMNRRRLDFEGTRDAMLAAAGRLDTRVGGPSVRDITTPGATRRTLYGFIDRLNLPGLYRTFDFPDPNATSPKRDRTTVAPQALFLMNHPFVLDTARGVLSRRPIASEPSAPGRIHRLYHALYGRAPTEDEVQLAQAYFGNDPAPAVAWERYVQALLLANEFVFVD